MNAGRFTWGETTPRNAAGRNNLKTKRKVIIRDMGSFWAVAYVSRRKFTQHWRAQFCKSVKTREQVTEWISQQTNIEL